MKVIGLTGGIASGKSTVAAILKRLGAAIVNADEIAREVVEPGQAAWREIVAAFGPEVLQKDQSLDRPKLRKIIFENAEARKKLEAIIHPRVRAQAEEKIRQLGAAGHEVVVYEVPLLFEVGIHHWLRPVILVACDSATQRARIQARDGVTETEARKTIEAQMSLEEKRRLADYIIENNGTLDDLERQVRELWVKLTTL